MTLLVNTGISKGVNNMGNELQLKPTYWASVSGGKDSLYMLNLILHNLDKYQLNGVVHFELEIDFPFIKNVIDYMEAECTKHGIPFVRIKPRKTWIELYNNYGFPTRVTRWCNSKYKLDAQKQLVDFMKQQGYAVYSYIGYCADEIGRVNKRKSLFERYPLVEEGIEESIILEWAKNVPIFNDYYKYNRRCGCMYCPMASYDNMAYLYKYYPAEYQFMIDKMKETEKKRSEELGRPFAIMQSNPKYNAEYIDNIVKTKYIKKLKEGN